MKSLAVLSLAALSLAALAQAGPGADTPPPLATAPLHGAPGLKGEDILAVPGRVDTWLVTGANEGLILVEGNGSGRTLARGNFEALDARDRIVIDGEAVTLVSAIDKNSGAIVLFALDQAADSLRELSRVESASALPETQCLYRDPRDGHVSLFAVDARGMVWQRIIHDGGAGALVDIAVRGFVGVPDAQACAVDDSAGALYIAEESLGVWRYRAEAETDATREPVALAAPHGSLGGEVLDLAIVDSGELWVMSAAPALLQRYTADGLVASHALDGIEGAKTLALARRGGGLMLAFFDEDSDSYRHAALALPAPVSAAPAAAVARVLPGAETAAVARFGDAADDPVIWVDPRNPGRSLIIGTDKREGLKVYNLDGHLRQSLDIGRLNNVDLIADTTVNGRRQPLLAASNRTLNSIALFTIDARARVHHLGDIDTGLGEVYGLCMTQSGSGDYVFVNDTDGRYQQYRVTASDGVRGERVREFALPSQPEGCAVDPLAGVIYMGEERAGIWRAGVEPDAGPPRKILSVDGVLVADVEGMDVYAGAGRNYLVVSSQGNDSYLVYGLSPGYPRLAHFTIGANLAAGVDGVSETDGLAVTSAALPGYPEGVLVVQDGRNRMPEEPQNFKLVDWRQVQRLIDRATP
ncbi:MAG TPA: phytase [Porticoccaceae bacterium]|nr:phytase [Porticoccaceae bacterium]